MTTLVPRGPYNAEELKQLYPEQLQLQQVQILLRHGERSPVSVRFQNAGMPAFWPFCNAAKRMTNSVMRDREASEWTDLKWRRRLESFGHNDRPEVARGPKGEVDGVCNLGELTDTGRETTLALGQRLRHLYVEQLGFMPKTITSADSFYLRATPMARALESLQQSFEGMYPLNARIGAFPPMTIITRPPSDETLFPNESNCRRFSQLSRAFGQRAADKWNNTSDMDYLNKLLSKWMPEDSKRVAVDSHPRLSGIMDTTNSSLAHSSEVHLPKEFYDAKGRGIMEKIGVDEWFSGFQEMEEYRKVGIGSLVGDLVTRMVGYVEKSPHDGIAEVGGQTGELGDGRHGETSIRFGMFGCHDTTLAAILSSFGVFQGERWPPYTSHIAVELFKSTGQFTSEGPSTSPPSTSGLSLWSSIFGKPQDILHRSIQDGNKSMSRKKSSTLSPEEKAKMDGYYVRLRFNDRPMAVPGCKLPGKHLGGDVSFCTLEAFKAIADKFTPDDWRVACNSNLDKPKLPSKPEPAGYA